MLSNMRLVGPNKHYWKNQLETYTEIICEEGKACRVQFGKQDIRGGFSICWFSLEGTVCKQIHFENKNVMLGYVQGFNDGVRLA